MGGERAWRPAANRQAVADRWRFLESEPDGYAVLSRAMEVLYLNATARALVAPAWWGRRCWETFPVGEASCAACCPAVRAVRAANEIVYCEEVLYVSGTPQVFGVAVIPIEVIPAGGSGR